MDTQITSAPNAILFDWDNTLVDSWHSSFEALNTTLSAMGHPAWSEEEARCRGGGSARELFPVLFGDAWQEAEKIYYDAFNKVFLKNLRVMDGAPELLDQLREHNLAMAIVSNKRGNLLRAEIAHLGWQDYFSSVIGAGDAARDKPSADPALMALREMGLSAGKDIWFIGDSLTDMACAHKSGCLPVLVETGVPPEDVLKKHPPALRFNSNYTIMEYIGDYFTRKLSFSLV